MKIRGCCNFKCTWSISVYLPTSVNCQQCLLNSLIKIFHFNDIETIIWYVSVLRESAEQLQYPPPLPYEHLPSESIEQHRIELLISDKVSKASKQTRSDFAWIESFQRFKKSEFIFNCRPQTDECVFQSSSHLKRKLVDTIELHYLT